MLLAICGYTALFNCHFCLFSKFQTKAQHLQQTNTKHCILVRVVWTIPIVLLFINTSYYSLTYTYYCKHIWALENVSFWQAEKNRALCFKVNGVLCGGRRLWAIDLDCSQAETVTFKVTGRLCSLLVYSVMWTLPFFFHQKYKIVNKNQSFRDVSWQC